VANGFAAGLFYLNLECKIENSEYFGSDRPSISQFLIRLTRIEYRDCREVRALADKAIVILQHKRLLFLRMLFIIGRYYESA
jgi:hypothetical protein